MDKAVASGGEAAAELFVGEKADYMRRQSLGGVAYKYLLAIGGTEGRVGYGGGYARQTHGHSFEQFVLQAGTYAHGRDKELRGGIGFAYVG